MDLDFLEQKAEFKEPDEIYHGPNLKGINRMTRREFTQGVLNVYQQLGGDTWLLQQAKIDPKSFLDMLKKIIPTNMNLDDIAGLQINLIDRYGKKAEIIKEKPADEAHLAHTEQPVTSPSTLAEGESGVVIRDRFDSPAPLLTNETVPDQTVACDSPDFDFEL